MLLYSCNECYRKKVCQICSLVLKQFIAETKIKLIISFWFPGFVVEPQPAQWKWINIEIGFVWPNWALKQYNGF